jgi:hypothetical protein
LHRKLILTNAKPLGESLRNRENRHVRKRLQRGSDQQNQGARTLARAYRKGAIRIFCRKYVLSKGKSLREDPKNRKIFPALSQEGAGSFFFWRAHSSESGRKPLRIWLNFLAGSLIFSTKIHENASKTRIWIRQKTIAQFAPPPPPTMIH